MSTPPTDDLALLRQCLSRTLEDLHALIHHKDNRVPEELADIGAENVTDADLEIGETSSPKPASPARPASRASRAGAENTHTLSGQLVRLDKQLKLIALAIKATADLAALEAVAAKTMDTERQADDRRADNTSDTDLLTLLTQIATAREEISGARDMQTAPPRPNQRE